jgi:hypothetical protein
MFFWNRRSSIAAACLFAIGGPQAVAQAKICATPHAVHDVLFKPGDVWKYKARPEDPESTLTILKVESLDEVGIIVHIRVDGLRMRTSDGSEMTSVGHMPIARPALAQSILVKLHSGAVPDFAEGYMRWANDCGGVYTITVSESITADQQALLHGTQH